MKIIGCDLNRLARLMGSYATPEMARHMVDQLLAAGYDDTHEPPDAIWDWMVGCAVDKALREEGGRGCQRGAGR